MNLDEMIKVGMADLQLCKSPGVLTTLGLGSCVGVALTVHSLRIILIQQSTQIVE